MPNLTVARTAAAAALAVASAGLVSVAVAPASAAPTAGGTGSIIYDRGGDLYQTTPDGTVTHRITTGGSTATSDKTGSSGYSVPTESDNGLIAAVRNQNYGGYQQGFIWVMDRNGKVLRKFKPPQFDLLPQFAGCSGPNAQLPQGIINATISPDGAHLAYTATAIANSAGCQAMYEVGSWVVNIDGSHGHWLSAGPYATADLQIGRWVSRTRLLIDRFDFGSTEDFYVDLPTYTATSWSAPDDMIDGAYEQQDVANGVLVTDGYSATSYARVIRVWATTGYGSAPSHWCEYGSVAHPGATDVNLDQPSLSPDGAHVVYEDYDNSAPNARNAGIYMAPAAAALASAAGCADANPSLFVQGAKDPFWTPASITQLPPDKTAPTATLTAPSRAATTSSSVKVSWSGHDDYSGVAYYQLRKRVAAYSAGFTSWSTPANWQHLTARTVTATGLARGKDYCFEVRAVDHAGNTSAWTPARCTAVALDDRSLTRSTGWTKRSGRAYYAGTITTTTRKGAALTRTHAVVDRIAVLATTCPSCGSISVVIGARHVGTINLHSSRTKQQVLRSLPTFGMRSGTVRLTVTTSGKTVAIDGMVLSRT